MCIKLYLNKYINKIIHSNILYKKKKSALNTHDLITNSTFQIQISNFKLNTSTTQTQTF